MIGWRGWVRLVTLWAMALVWVSAAGCSGCNVGECEEGCEYFEACIAGQCVIDPNLLCTPPCGDGEFCEQGQCIEVVRECAAIGQTCDPRRPFQSIFYCVDWDGFARGAPAVCSAPCDASGACQEEAACYVLSGAEEPACTAQSDCAVGRQCIAGRCRPAACRASECEGYVEGLQTCADLYRGVEGYENSAACYQTLDGAARFCAPGGFKVDGQSCITHKRALQQGGGWDATCAPGLGCVDGRCKIACLDRSQCIDPEHECLLKDDPDVIEAGAGFCGKPCAAFSVGECGDGFKCSPISATEGFCIEAGPEAAFEACVPTSTGQCVEGTMCAPYTTTSSVIPLGRCMPLCNVTVAPSATPGGVTSTEQARRDATCPQPQVLAEAHVWIAHLAQNLGPLDLYVDQETTPRVTLDYEDILAGANGAGWLALPPGLRIIAARRAGAPITDAPVAEIITALEDQRARYLVIGAPSPVSGDDARAWAIEATPAAAPMTGMVQLVHTIGDAEVISVVATPPQARADAPEAITLATSLQAGKASAFVALASGTYDLHVLDRFGQRLVLIPNVSHGAGAPEVWLLRGTVDPDDGASATGLTRRAWTNIPETVVDGPTLRCTDPGNGVWGSCEQRCEGLDTYGSTCDGPQMGCQPVQLPASLGWASLCRPVGELEGGAPCAPNAQPPACAEGFTCQAFGAGAADAIEGLPAGRCVPLCDAQAAEGASTCATDQQCDVLSEGLPVGRCAWLCEPQDDYTDTICPDGLGTCKPRARLVEQASSEVPPSVETRAPICSPSGLVAVGASCQGDDCAPGSECLFPRSTQGDLTTSILSHYFSDGTSSPTCRPICDPFERGPDARGVTCDINETCLVNFPWSADVGHCAPLTERVDPMTPCTSPGHACNTDSVCVVDGAAPFCLRLCQYTGGASASSFAQSTCPQGYGCAPLVNDVGYCIAR